MKKLIYISLFTFLFAFSAHAQTKPTDCEVCSSRLEKVLTSLDASDKVIAAKDAEIEAKDKLNATNEAIIANLKFIAEQKDKLIEILQKKSEKKICILTCAVFKIRY